MPHTRVQRARTKKLICDTVEYAKQMGDRLLSVKENLRHGEYRNWVEANFDGGVSTARVYTRIANPKNWSRIAAQPNVGALTIAQALELLKQR